MDGRRARLLVLAGAAALAGGRTLPAEAADAAIAGAPPAARVRTLRLPSLFEENRGQAPDPARFVCRAAGTTLLLRDDGADVRTADGALALRFVGGRAVRPSGEDVARARTNVLVGPDPAQWVRGARNFGATRQRGVWDGVDVRWHTDAGRVEYDFEVAPGADATRIRLRLDGADDLRVDAAGRLVARAGAATFVHKAPRAWQVRGGAQVPVDARFTVDDDGVVAFALGATDPALPFVIDPATTFSTYLGGSESDEVNACATDAAGYLWVAGTTSSARVPSNLTPPRTSLGPESDAFVARIDPASGTLDRITFLGGSGADRALALAVDAQGRAHVAGDTTSIVGSPYPTGTAPYAFPTTQDPIGPGGYVDGFVTILTPGGAGIVWSSRIGGTGDDGVHAIALDSQGRIDVAGRLGAATAFPLAVGGTTSPTFGGGAFDAIRMRLPVGGGASALSVSVVGGAGDDRAYAVAVDATDGVAIGGVTTSPDLPDTDALATGFGGGVDGFVACFDAAGAPRWTRWIGGVGYDFVYALVRGDGGDVAVFGATDANALAIGGAFQPVNRGGGDGFAALLAADDGRARRFTYLGGRGADEIRAASRTPGGDWIVAGSTTSDDLPASDGAFQHARAGGADAFVARLSPDLATMRHATYHGGAGDDVARGVASVGDDAAFVAGSTLSSDLPTTGGTMQPATGGGADGFAALLPVAGPAAPTLVRADVRDDHGYGVNLEWTGSPDAVAYRVVRTELVPEVVATELPEIPAGTTTHRDAPVQFHFVYLYRVLAVDAAGRTSFSNAVVVSPAVGPPPGPEPVGPPADFGAILAGVRAILIWSPAPGDVVAYEIERAVGAGEFEPLATVRGNVTTHNARLPGGRGETVRFRIRAVGAEGPSDWAGPVAVTVGDTLEIGLLRGVVSPPGRLTLGGRFAFGDRRRGFDPAREDLTIEVGEADGDPAPGSVTIPAGDLGWRASSGRLEWRSSRSAFGAVRGRVVLDRRRHRLQARLRGLTLAEIPTPFSGVQFLGVHLVLGDDDGTSRTTWVLRRRDGAFVLR